MAVSLLLGALPRSGLCNGSTDAAVDFGRTESDFQQYVETHEDYIVSALPESPDVTARSQYADDASSKRREGVNPGKTVCRSAHVLGGGILGCVGGYAVGYLVAALILFTSESRIDPSGVMISGAVVGSGVGMVLGFFIGKSQCR
jgi:hypothetical protein